MDRHMKPRCAVDEKNGVYGMGSLVNSPREVEGTTAL